MAHVRTQIRAAVKAALEAGLPSASYDVFAGRKFARNRTDAALVDLVFRDDQGLRETMGDDRVHSASLYIRVQRDAAEDGLDDLLDADEVAIVDIMEATDFSALLEEDPELVQTNWVEDADSGRAFGGIVLRYDMEYRIDKTDPETVIA